MRLAAANSVKTNASPSSRTSPGPSSTAPASSSITESARFTAIVWRMRKAREASQTTTAGPRPKSGLAQSDERLRRLLHQAQQTTDARKRSQLKEKFMKEFYEGAR